MSDVEPSLISDIVPYWAKREPGRLALIDRGQSWTYAALDRAIGEAADWLVRHGTRRGDRVMLVCENSCAAVAMILAASAMGAWPVIVNARLSDREIDEIRAHCEARLVVLTIDVSPRAKAQAERLVASTVTLGALGNLAVTAANEIAEQEREAADPAERVAAMIYTSGTTGRPKGVMLSHAGLMFVARASAEMRAMTAEDRVYAVLPVSHILGLTGVLLGSLVSGACVHLTARFDPASALAAIARDRVSLMIGTPSMYALLAEYATRKGLVPIAGEALRLLCTAGAPLDAATKKTVEAAFARPLYNGYGISECGPTITLTPVDAPRADCGVGVPMQGVEIRLVGADGAEVAEGEVGELFVRSPGVMKGYYRAPAETAEVIDRDGWFRSGDLARFADGSLFIVGRAKEMIIRFGFNVYPAEIEGVLNAHPAVARAAVVGRQANGSEDVLAFVSLRDGARASNTEIADYAATKLAPYKRPAEIVVLPALPTNAAGKILKSELAAMAAR